MSIPRNPWFWLFFGLFCFPLLCKSADWPVLWAITNMGLSAKFPIHRNTWMFISIFFANAVVGQPLGILTALCVGFWNRKRFVWSRLLALCGGLIISVAWLDWVRDSLPIQKWVSEFAYLAPPLLWAICLVIFALFARPEKEELSDEPR